MTNQEIRNERKQTEKDRRAIEALLKMPKGALSEHYFRIKETANRFSGDRPKSNDNRH